MVTRVGKIKKKCDLKQVTFQKLKFWMWLFFFLKM